MTQLNLTLSPNFLSSYVSPTNNGIWMDAVVFDNKGGTWVSTTPLIANGALQFTGATGLSFPTNTNWPGSGSQTASISLPASLPNGSVYFIMTSAPTSTATDPILTILENNSPGPAHNPMESNIIPSSLLRFSQFEVNLSSLQSDMGDITNVNSFGFPMQLAVYGNSQHPSNWDTRGYNALGANGTGNYFWSQINTIESGNTIWSWANPTGAGPNLNSGNRSAVGPAWASYPPNSATPIYQASDWSSTINKLITMANAAQNVSLGTVEGTSNSTTDVTFFNSNSFNLYHNEGFLNYNVSWVQNIYYGGSTHSGPAFGASQQTGLPTGLTNQGYFVLSPSSDSSVKGYIVISPYGDGTGTDNWQGGLANSIYSQLGKILVFASDPTVSTSISQSPLSFTNQNTPPSATGSQESAYMSLGTNNAWSTVVRNFVAGLDSGFYGGATGNSPNSAISSTIDLSKQWNQNPYFAYDGFQSGAVNNFVFSDPYAQIFYANSNAYGYSYSDANDSFFAVGPLLNVGVSGGGNVSNINIALYGDGEAAGGYVANKSANYLAPATSGTLATSADSIKMNFSDLAAYVSNYSPAQNNQGQLSWIIDPSKSKITIQVYDPNIQQWSTPAAIQSTGSIWSDFSLSYAAPTTPGNQGTLSAVTTGVQNYNSGTLALNTLPVVKGAVTWYQVNVSDQSNQHATTFNLYAQTNASGQFDLTQVSPVQVDGTAQIDNTASTATTQSILFARTGLNISAYDPYLVSHTTPISYKLDGSPNYTQLWPTNSTPFAPIIGLQGSSYYSAISDAPVDQNGNNANFSAVAGQGWTSTNSNITAPGSGFSSLIFGWTGTNNPLTYLASTSNTQLANYTNKVVPNDLVQITVTNTQYPQLNQTVYAQADSDGQWQTGQSVLVDNKSFISIPLTLAPGSYTATFTEFSPLTTEFWPGTSPNLNQMGPQSSTLSFTVSGTAPSANVPSITVNLPNTNLWMLYDTAFGRLPDQQGFTYWAQTTSGVVNSGTAQTFLSTSEAQAIYGNTSNNQFVELLYAHALDRAPDAGGYAYWVGQLATSSRADVLWGFASSPEHASQNAAFIQNGYWTTPNSTSSQTHISSALIE